MPIVRDVPLSLGTEEVLRLVGMGQGSRLRPWLTTLLDEMLAAVSDLHLMEPAIAYEFWATKGASDERVFLEGSTTRDGRLLSTILLEAAEVVTVVATVGSNLEESAAGYFRKGEPLKGLLLDAIGSAAVDSLIEEACKLVTREASCRGHGASSPLRPGMCGFPIAEQRPLLRMMPTEQIGVNLTASGMMVPRKSASAVIGIGPQMRIWTRAGSCVRCRLRKTCPYRVRPRVREGKNA